jgi:hypothetical protein
MVGDFVSVEILPRSPALDQDEALRIVGATVECVGQAAGFGMGGLDQAAQGLLGFLGLPRFGYQRCDDDDL